jgi:hypothetical protein
MAEDASDGGPMRQDIEFAGNTSLGISVDEDLRARRRRRRSLRERNND